MSESSTPANPYDLKAAIGGVRGFIDSSIPPLVFVLVRIISGNLRTAIVSSIAVGAAMMLLRIQRKESTQQAVTGFLGVAIAAAVSAKTGTGKGFFLPGILMVAAMGVGGLISILVRRPFVGLGLAAFDKRYADWREDSKLYRACQISSIVWTISFFLRATVATIVYSAAGDHPGKLLIIINVVKIPSMIIAGYITYILVKRATPARELDAAEPA